MQFALANIVVKEMLFAEQCAYLASVGYDGIEVAPFTLSDAPERMPKRARAELRRSAEDAELARRHNDANVLALGGRTTTAAVARQCLKVFLTSDFDGGRHAKRVAKLS